MSAHHCERCELLDLRALRDDCLAARDEIRGLRSDLAREEAAHALTIEQRDNAEEWADRLAYAAAPESEIGEHSNLNNPWANALKLIEGKH